MVSPTSTPMFSPWGAANKPAWGILLRLGPKLSQIVERIADCLAVEGQLGSVAFRLDIVSILEHLIEFIWKIIWKGKRVQRHRQSVDFGTSKLVEGLIHPRKEILLVMMVTIE